jgi:hypothetical protein
MRTTLFVFLAIACSAIAEVPSLINYQGRLTGPGGAPASGSKNFALKIYDAATEGTLLYSEDVGAITLGEGGVYSFRFGGSGTSNTLVTETVGTGTDAVLYQKVLSNTPVVAGSVSVTDGTYTWSQAGGSSNEDDFTAAFSTNLNRITVNYFAGAPGDGREIEVTYRYGAAGIVGALSSGSGHWLQLTIDGQIQATRERVLAVPFALRAGSADKVEGSGGEKYAFLPWNTAAVSGYNVRVSTFPTDAKVVKQFRVGVGTAGDPRRINILIYRIDLDSPGMANFLEGAQSVPGDSEGELIYIAGSSFVNSPNMIEKEPAAQNGGKGKTWLFVHEPAGGLELDHSKYAYEFKVQIVEAGNRKPFHNPFYARITYTSE